MENKQVEIGKSFSYGWESVKKNLWYFIGLALIVMIIEGLPNTIWHERSYSGLLGLILNTWMTCGFMKIVLDFHDGKKRELVDVFQQIQYFWRVLGATLLVGIIVGLGFILLIVPGIYLALRFQFTVPLIIDKNLSIGEAMKKSTELSKGIKIDLFVFGLAALGVIILGFIALGVGIFVAMPVVWLAYIYLYKKLITGVPADKPQTNIK